MIFATVRKSKVAAGTPNPGVAASVKVQLRGWAGELVARVSDPAELKDFDDGEPCVIEIRKLAVADRPAPPAVQTTDKP